MYIAFREANLRFSGRITWRFSVGLGHTSMNANLSRNDSINMYFFRQAPAYTKNPTPVGNKKGSSDEWCDIYTMSVRGLKTELSEGSVLKKVIRVTDEWPFSTPRRLEIHDAGLIR
jgi:hypothetical protein